MRFGVKFQKRNPSKKNTEKKICTKHAVVQLDSASQINDIGIQELSSYVNEYCRDESHATLSIPCLRKDPTYAEIIKANNWSEPE